MTESLQVHEQDIAQKSNLLLEEVATKEAAQHELEMLNQQLEQRVKDRTAELISVNEKLIESESKFHSLVENIPAVTYQANLNGDEPDLIYVSPQIADISGFQPDEWMAKDRRIRQIHQDDLSILKQYYGQMRSNVDHYMFEYRILSRSGKTIWVRDQGKIKSRGDNSLYIQGVLSDITLEREQTEILVQQALHDGLTGLPNRNLFIERLEHMMICAQRQTDVLFAVLFLVSG